MGIMAQEGGTRTERELIPMDLHRAVCVNVVDLGSHENKQYGKLKRLVRLTFELADVRDDFDVDGEVKNLPRLIAKQYNLSLHENATLRKDLQAWRKKAFTAEELRGFDIATLVGVPCMINTEHYTGHDGKVRCGVGSIVGLAKGMQAPAPEGEAYYYGIEDHGREFPESMPDFLKEKIMSSVEMAPAVPPPAPPPQAAAPARATAPPAPMPEGGYALDAGAYAEEAEEDCPF